MIAKDASHAPGRTFSILPLDGNWRKYCRRCTGFQRGKETNMSIPEGREGGMRTVEEVTADVKAVYISLRQMFDHWRKGMHGQFMEACWRIDDLRKELVEITGSRDEAFKLVRNVYHQVFSAGKEAER
jgi:hypothetical protein